MPHRWDPVAPPARGLVHPTHIDPTGLAGPTPGQARGPSWRRTTAGMAVPAHVDAARPEQRIVEEAARVRECGAVTGWAALRLHGATFFDGLGPDGRTPLPVPLVEGTGRLRPTAGTTVSRARLAEPEVVRRYDVRCTAPERAVAVLAAPGLRARVVAIDMACAGRVSSLIRIRQHVARQRPRRRDLVLWALDLASERSLSPGESAFRLVWVLDARWQAPLCNAPVFAPTGELLGVPDLLDVRRGVAGEYDGAEHRGRERHRGDVRKEEALRDHGLEVVRMVAGDSPARITRRLRSAEERARRGVRRWVGGAPGESLDAWLDARDRRRETRDTDPS